MSTETLQTADTLAARVRLRLDELVGRVRQALDLPSRTELMDLTRRLEALDRRISELAAERVAEMATVIPALPEGNAEAEVEADAPATDPEAAGAKRGAKQRKK